MTSMRRRQERHDRAPQQIRADLAKKRERHEARCHATVSYPVLNGMAVSKASVGCVLPGGHEGPHEGKLEGKPYVFSDEQARQHP